MCDVTMWKGPRNRVLEPQTGRSKQVQRQHIYYQSRDVSIRYHQLLVYLQGFEASRVKCD